MAAKIALIDLDGTVADYDKAIQQEMTSLRSEGEGPYQHYSDNSPDYIKKRLDLIRTQPGFWKYLEPIEAGLQVVQEMRVIGYTLHVLTKGPRRARNAWTEKAEWVDIHMPDAAVTVTHDKSIVYGRVLFDDFPPYFLPWLEARPRGLAIALSHPWNQGVEHPRLIRHDGSVESLRKVREALQIAYDRPETVRQ